VRWVAPDTPQGVGLWLTHLGGSAEQTAPMLALLSERELLAASFDPPGHGRRSAGGVPWELAEEVLGVFRRRMWPLAGRAAVLSRARMAGAGRAGVRTEPPPKTDGTGSAMTSTARMRLPTTAT
jgi:hypothetical protein